MKHPIQRITLGFLFAISFSSAFATPPIPYGWYLGADGGVIKIHNKSYPGSVSNNNTGYEFNGGYKFSPFAATEINYIHYSDTIIKTSGVQVARDRRYSYAIVAKGIMPIGVSGAALFMKAGIGRLQSNLSVTNAALAAQNNLTFNSGTHISTGPFVALGGEFAFTPNFMVNLQASRAKGNSQTGNTDLYSAGCALLY